MSKKTFKIYALALVLFVNLFVWTMVTEKNDHELTVAFLDVGQGDAIFVRTPSGKQMLVDGGAPGGAVLRELGKVMPFYDRSINVVVATHPDQDHIGGLVDVFERYSVDLFVRTMTTSTTDIFKTIMDEVGQKEIKEKIIIAPDDINFGDGVDFKILYPDTDTSGWVTNDSSIVGKLNYGFNSFLLTGDSPIKIEQKLIKKYGYLLKSDVLKAGHHGSKGSNSLAYIEKVRPTYSIISAGLNNRYGHPAKEALANLTKFGSQILETMGKGMVVFKSDSEKLILLPQPSLK